MDEELKAVAKMKKKQKQKTEVWKTHTMKKMGTSDFPSLLKLLPVEAGSRFNMLMLILRGTG